MEIKDYLKDFLYCIAKEMNDVDAFAVKGYFALMTQTANKGVTVDRLSKDLDLQVLNRDKWEEFIENFNSVDHPSPLNIKYRLKAYDLRERSRRYVFVADGLEMFSVDANFDTKDYGYDKLKVNDVKVNFFTPSIMLADKLSAAASPKIYRRTKDLFDIYLLSSVFEFKLPKLVKSIKSKRDIDVSHIEIYKPRSLEQIKAGYNALKFGSASAKPDFDEVYERIKYFTYPIYASLNEEGINKIYWDRNEWVSKEEFMRNNFKKKGATS